ncbi:MAG: single-stranded-DNA-specific exonuclease RecJ [Bacillota bacterium]
MQSKRWYIKKSNHENNNILRKILEKRGISKSKEDKFLNPSLSDLNNPFDFSDMKKAVSLILEIIEKKGKIIIFGDYDVDGITSTSLLYLFIKEYFNYKIDYYIPDRMKEGYGLNPEAVKEIISKNYDLMITVDCGITAHEEFKLAKRNNLKTIVTDHHQPGDDLPEADYILNPKIKDCSYPFKKLAGVGVAFKLCQGIVKYEENKEMIDLLQNKLDIVALGTVADIVSLTEENRIMVKKGLELINKNKRYIFKSLKNKLGLEDKKITTGHIGFMLAPPFNASGRMEDAETGVKLLTTTDPQKTEKLIDKIIKLNRERQKREKEILKEAEIMAENQLKNNEEKNYALILFSEDWHPGIIGIVASKMVEKYYRPTIMIATDENGVGKGSARSIKYLNLFDALKDNSEYFIDYGGHSQAAGLSIKKENIEKFASHFNKYLQKYLTDDVFIPEQKIDLIIDEDDIDYKLYTKIEKMSPFGIDNSKPVFAITNVNIKKAYQVGKENKHLKIETENGIKGIAFNKGNLYPGILNSKVDIAFNLSLNEWNGKRNVELKIKDIKFKENPDEFPLVFRSDKFSIFDKRGCKQKFKYLNNILNLKKHKKNIAIYSDNKFDEDFYSKLNISRENFNLEVFNDFEKINKNKMDILIFFSLPETLNDLKVLLNYINSGLDIYLLYGENDFYNKCDDLKKRVVTRKNLVKFYKLIFQENKNFNYSNLVKFVEKNLNVNEKFVVESLEILRELDLVEKKDNEVFLNSKPETKLDLSNSLRYNKNTSFIEKFNYFSKIAFNKNLFLLIDEINNYLEEDKNES